MDTLQSFLGCMYPGGIRTDSIESIDRDYEDCSYPAANIDEQGNEVSRGELRLREKDLTYIGSGRFVTRWPLGYIRRYGCSDDGILTFEAGRRCTTGQAIFAFKICAGSDLAQRLKQRIDRLEPTETNEDQAQVESAKSDNSEPSNPSRQTKRDASTSTENQAINKDDVTESPDDGDRGAQPLPLSYAMIDFDTTKALNESARSHAANRIR